MVILPSASNPITLRCCCPLITTASTPRVSMAETWCVDLTEGKILSNILCASRGATGCLNSQDPAPSTATGTTGHHCHCWLVLCPVPLYNKNWLILHSPYNCLTSQLKLLVTDESCILATNTIFVWFLNNCTKMIYHRHEHVGTPNAY